MSTLVRLVLAAVVLVPLLQPATAQNVLASLTPKVPPKDRICFTLYTVHAGTLKLTAQFYPIKDFEPFSAVLQIKQDGDWVERAVADIIYPGYTATFRIDDWDDSQEREYRVVHNDAAFYEGVVRASPVDKSTFVMAALSCNSLQPNHGGDISRADIVDNLKRIEPDLLFFAGDQVYDHSEHYLNWLKFGKDFEEILRCTPTICLPDDHDVGQANLWGAGGKRCDHRNGINGGYYMPVAYVQEVERAQTSHLPDPYDPTPIERGIGVYYTGLTWGGISFAILEDRKFKSGPGQYMGSNQQRGDSITTPGQDTRKFDAPDAVLLGERQLKFLDEWTTDWNGAEMKCVLSQTVFAQSCNYSGDREKQLYADFDSNGWPQSGRDRALGIIRKSYSCMVAGDQHLGTVIHHGIDEWRDAGYSFAVPAIANYWLRWWAPSEPGRNRAANAPSYTGDFYDGFRNRITMVATANPTQDEQLAEGSELSVRASGFGIVKFNKPQRTITFECWPRNVDITNPSSEQYPGWPITIRQSDNYRMVDGFALPRLQLATSNEVVTVVDRTTCETISSLRVQGTSYQPSTPTSGTYDVVVGEGDDQQWIRNLQAKKANDDVVDMPIGAAN